MSGAPHLPQKLEDGGFSALHFAHDLVSAFPHCAQKLLPGVLFVAHFLQRTGVPPTGRMAFCIIERREVTATSARCLRSKSPSAPSHLATRHMILRSISIVIFRICHYFYLPSTASTTSHSMPTTLHSKLHL